VSELGTPGGRRYAVAVDGTRAAPPEDGEDIKDRSRLEEVMYEDLLLNQAHEHRDRLVADGDRHRLLRRVRRAKVRGRPTVSSARASHARGR
jgi:hypothetical protein